MKHRRPNTRVQRTRSSPSALRSPLTRCPLGARSNSWAAVALVLSCVTSCRSSGIAKYCCPQPENEVVVAVHCLGPDGQGSVKSVATVLFRDSDGSVLFRSVTDREGRVTIPIDYRAVKFDQRFEALLFRDTGLGEVGAIAGGSPGTKQYEILVCAEPRAEPQIRGAVLDRP